MSKETDKRWKGFVIDWAEISDMDSIDYELKALNQQQVAILLALLQYQKWQTRWLNLELSNDELQAYIGDIEYRLMQNAGENMATVEEICQAIECGLEKAAARYLSGTSENLSGGTIEINNGNEVSVIPPGQAPDDPTTASDEEARAGGSNAIRLGLNKLFSDMNAWFTAGVLVADAKTRLLSLYALNQTEAEAFVDFYYTTYATPANPIVLALALESNLYCDGISTQSIARYVYDTHTPSTDAATIIQLLPALGSQLMAWYRQGELIPSSSYVGYSCVPVDPDSVDFVNTLNSSVTQTLTVTQKVNHRVRFQASGKTFNPDGLGGYQDFLYAVSAAGVATLLPNSTGLDFFGVFNKPTAGEVPFEPSGVYDFTRETVSAGIPQFRYRTSWSTGANGTISLNLTDLGEFLT